MRVPPDPSPPAGAPESVRVFRAGENYYKFRLLGWTLTQLVGIAGIVFWIAMLGVFERNIDEARRALEIEAARAKAAATQLAARAQSAVPAPSAAPATEATAAKASPSPAATDKAAKKKSPRRPPNPQWVRNIPTWLIWLLRVLELVSIAGFVAQLPFTLAVLRLDFELRWYIVTDRSLRIRSGIWRLQEITMSFANIQQVSVTRGPIQGLLKISDVRVQSAGGGGGDPKHGHGDSLHTGIFHGVDNAQEIRDLVLERLRQFRATGLGDPDDAHEHPHPIAAASPAMDPTLAAAQELLAEARALRVALQAP